MLDPFEIAIQALPATKLRELLQQIDEQVAGLKEQRATVKRVLDAQESRRASGGAKRRKRGTVNRTEKLRRVITATVNSGSRNQWLPVDLQERLAEEGEQLSREYIRKIARTLVEEGEIARHHTGDGFAPLPAASANGTGNET